jgi:drug/metabolite transporter, DME family
MNPRTSMTGILMVLCAAVLWGTTGTAQSFAPLTLSPYVVGAMRLAMSAVFFAGYLGVTRQRTPTGLQASTWAALPWRWVLSAGACMAVYNLTFFAGVKASSVAVGTAVAIGSGPIWAGMLQFAVTGKAPSAVWWWGTVLAVAGGSLMVMGGAHSVAFSVSGIALCLAAGLTYAAYALINKRLVAQSPPAVVTAGVFSTAAVMAMPVAWCLSDTVVLSGSAWLVVSYLGFVATGVAYLLFSSGLRYISGATGVTLALGEPVMAFLLAIVVIGERPGVMAVCGLGLVLLGLALVIRTELQAEKSALR